MEKQNQNCCGCSACYNVCPNNAIEMKADSYGFDIPTINKEKCTNCGLCDKVCPNRKKIDNKFEKIAYAAFNKNDDERIKSSSGGIFILLAEKIIDQKGIVFGAYVDDENKVQHGYASDRKSLKKFMGSKYVQSRIGDSYKIAKDFLEKGTIVFFTGTPCQIEGLKSYLMKDYSNLYTQDIICHGVPSPLVWEEYKKYRNTLDKKSPTNICFRDKEKGWKEYNIVFNYDDYNYKEKATNDLYMQAFLKNTSLRESCYQCLFKDENKISDITLGDYWGIQNVHPELDDDKGISAVIINSEKGKALIEQIKDEINCIETDYEEIKKYNSALIKSSPKDSNRDKFFRNLDKLPFDELVKKYTYKPSFFRKVINKLKYELWKMIKNNKTS